MTLFLIVLIILFLLIIGSLFYAANFLFNGILDRKNTWFNDDAHGAVNSDINAMQSIERQKRDAEQREVGSTFYEAYREEVTITSFDGLELYGRTYVSTPTSNKWVIGFHGYRTDGETDMGYIASQIVEIGFNYLIVDQRAHGKSTGRYVTMGWLERKDVLSWTDFIIKKENPEETMWLGDSMGASTVLMASGEKVPDVVHGIIADCGYNSLKDLFNYLLGSAFSVPSWIPILPFFSVISRKL